jgi:hypothetical protein
LPAEQAPLLLLDGWLAGGVRLGKVGTVKAKLMMEPRKMPLQAMGKKGT